MGSGTRLVKYQVFISSTYEDLREARDAVANAVLRMGHIPRGMELFTAAHRTTQATIKGAIDESDYYVLILGGRYGSIEPESGLSWTQWEYEYAIQRGKRILAFDRDRNELTDRERKVERRHGAKLEKFKKSLSPRHTPDRWLTAEQLAGLVRDALHDQIQMDIAQGNPAPGWHQGPLRDSAEVAEELAALMAENRRLRERLATLEVPARALDIHGVEYMEWCPPASAPTLMWSPLRHHKPADSNASAIIMEVLVVNCSSQAAGLKDLRLELTLPDGLVVTSSFAYFALNGGWPIRVAPTDRLQHWIHFEFPGLEKGLKVASARLIGTELSGATTSCPVAPELIAQLVGDAPSRRVNWSSLRTEIDAAVRPKAAALLSGKGRPSFER